MRDLQPTTSSLVQSTAQVTSTTQQPTTSANNGPQQGVTGEVEAAANDVTSDDEPHAETTMQVTGRRRRTKRTGQVPRHHLNHYTPRSKTVLRAGKIYVAQMILTRDAYPHDLLRREMGTTAWNHAVELEAEAFAQGSTFHTPFHVLIFFFQRVQRRWTIIFKD
jgi:hypothetical protein